MFAWYLFRKITEPKISHIIFQEYFLNFERHISVQAKLFPKYYIAYFGLSNIFKKIPCKYIPIFNETHCNLFAFAENQKKKKQEGNKVKKTREPVNQVKGLNLIHF